MQKEVLLSVQVALIQEIKDLWCISEQGITQVV